MARLGNKKSERRSFVPFAVFAAELKTVANYHKQLSSKLAEYLLLNGFSGSVSNRKAVAHRLHYELIFVT